MKRIFFRQITIHLIRSTARAAPGTFWQAIVLSNIWVKDKKTLQFKELVIQSNIFLKSESSGPAVLSWPKNVLHFHFFLSSL